MTLSRNSLKVRIVAPIFAIFTLTVLLLVFVLFNASHNVSKKTYAFIGRQQGDEVRRILDGAFRDLLDAQLLENRMVTEAKQRVTLDEVAAYLEKAGLDGYVVDANGRPLFETVAAERTARLKPYLATEGPFHFEEGFSHYNGYVIHFPAWGWKVLLLTPPVTWVIEAYSSEFGYLMPAAALLGICLFGLTLLVVRRNFQAPIDGILSDLDAKREIGRTEIAELDTIVDAINESFRQEKKLYEQLLRSQKLEALGTLAGGIAHDFNNLLTAIHGYAELLSDNPGDAEATRRFAGTILNAAGQGADLTRRILATTRKERMQVVPADLNTIVRTALGLLERSIPKQIEVVAVLDESIPGVMGDPSQLQQVIMNLAVNARDAMPEGGKLTLSTNWTDGEELQAEDRIRPTDGFVRLCISDTGHGMDADTRIKVFDPFFTTKETGKGTGLGLFIVHTIVANHGGKINIYSEPGQGTRFSVYLPATHEAAEAERVEECEISGSGTILVIDDEPDILALCGDLLGTLGYDVIVAGSGAEGVARFKERGDGIALVLLDMVMPKMGGDAVFRELKALRPDVKVLLSSGYSPDGYEGIDTLIREGVGGFISKPFSRKAIGLAIRNLIAASPAAAG